MNLLKKLFFQTNLIIFALAVSYSCSTNQRQSNDIAFDSNSEIREVIVTDRRFILESSIGQYSQYASRAENFLDYIVSNPRLMTRLTYDYTVDTREIILAKIKQSEGLIISRARIYTPLWRFSDVIAYHQNNVIYFNRYKLKRNECEIIATFVHEYMHRLGYSHGDNNPTNKANSVPYYMGGVANETCAKGRI